MVSAVLLWRAQGQEPAPDPILAEALPQIAKAASRFWQSAPAYLARETLKQRGLVMPKRKFRLGGKAVQPPKPDLKDHEIVSWYALSSYRATPEALHEFRELVSIDGKPNVTEAAAKERLRAALNSKDDWRKRELQEEYEKAGLGIAATDFGQLVLLFTKANVGKYSFHPRTPGLIGADRAVIIDFHQSAGVESLKILDAGKQTREPLSGQVWVRETDFQPLRIALNSVRRERSQEIRDEARVDYAPIADGTMLPSVVVYRRYINDDLFAENTYEYSGWQAVTAK